MADSAVESAHAPSGPAPEAEPRSPSEPPSAPDPASAKTPDTDDAEDPLGPQPYADALDAEIRARNEFMADIEAHIEECKAREEYLEADRSMRRLAVVQEEDKKARLLRVARKCQQEQDELDAVIAAEGARLEEGVDARRRRFEADAKAMRAETLQRLGQELETYTDGLERRHAQAIPKYSPALLELRHSQTSLIRQARYREAAAVRAKADARQAQEDERRMLGVEQNVARNRVAMRQRQTTEAGIVEEKIRAGRKALAKEAALERDRLRLKHNSVRHELAMQHKNEAGRLQRMPLGAPFELDSLGNDIMSTAAAGEALYRKQMGKDERRVRAGNTSMVARYVQGEITVRPGDTYYSECDRRAPASRGEAGSENGSESRGGCAHSTGTA